MRISDWSSDVCSSDLPLTTPIVWVIAYKVGNWLLHIDAMTYGQPLNSQVRGGDPGTWLQWLTGAVPVTALGLVVLAVVFGAIGYIVAGWRWRVGDRQRTRLNSSH